MAAVAQGYLRVVVTHRIIEGIQEVYQPQPPGQKGGAKAPGKDRRS